jgi:rhodanese-related sulfurtransferase
VAYKHEFVHEYPCGDALKIKLNERSSAHHSKIRLLHLLRIGSDMKFLIDNWVLFAVAFGSGAMLLWPAIRGGALGSGGSLNANGAVQLMNREKAVVVDVSEATDFAAGHIVGSKNLPSGELEAKLEASVKNKSLPLILVCPTGTRASRLVATAKKLGYGNVQAIAGGLKAWRDAGLPLEKA